MNEKDAEIDAEFPAEDKTPVQDSAADTQTLRKLSPPATKAKGSGVVAWLALLLSLLATAGAAYLLLQDWRARDGAGQSADTLAELRSRIANSSESLSNLDQGLAELAQADAQAASQFETLQRDLDERLQAVRSLPPRMVNIENSLSTLQGISTGARNTWLLAEAEHYMQIANAELQLAGNPRLAALALGMADERIAQLADPALTDVRRTLSDELANLEVMEKPDVEGVTLTLASLARVVDSLPLRPTSRTEAEDETAADQQLTGFNRAWASAKGVVTGLVDHSGPGDAAAPLMTPEAEYFLRTNLSLQLQAARLALLRGEQAVFQQSLDDAAAWLETYFDTDSEQIDGAVETIAEIRASMSDVSMPDISGSLRLLRQYNSVNESAQ